MLPTIVTVNPMAKRRHAHKKRSQNRLRRSRHRARAHNPGGHRRRRSHRRHRVSNPFSVKGLTASLMPAAIGAAGAVGLDIAMAYLPVPASLATGPLNTLTRAAAAIVLGVVAGKGFGKQIGQEVALGGLVVVGYSALKQALAPTLGTSIKGLSGLADFGDYTPAYSGQAVAMTGGGMGAYTQPRLGAYMSRGGMGAYMNPAALVGAGASPVRQKQMGAYGGGGFGGFGGYDSESM